MRATDDGPGRTATLWFENPEQNNSITDSRRKRRMIATSKLMSPVPWALNIAQEKEYFVSVPSRDTLSTIVISI